MLKSIVTMLILITPTLGAEQDSDSESWSPITSPRAESPLTELPSLGDSSALSTKKLTHQRSSSQGSLTPEQLMALEAQIKGEVVKGKTVKGTISPADYQKLLSDSSPQ